MDIRQESSGPSCESSSLLRHIDLLKKLRDGNNRFVEASILDRSSELHYTRKLLARDGQQPWAVMIGCSDSRVPIEKVFDVGLGEMFVVRVAGNCVDESALASVEFAVSSWNIGLVAIVGHRGCGAVAAAMNQDTKSSSPHIEKLLNRIRIATGFTSQRQLSVETDSTALEKMNAQYWQHYIGAHSELMQNRIASGETIICSAYYDTFSGKVRFSDSVETVLTNKILNDPLDLI